MRQKDERFGTIVFESDIDADPAVIYKMYDLRWLIEECFRYYKHAIELDDTKVHSDYSVIGSEFINFFASVMTVRLVNKFDDCGLFKTMSYAGVMSELATAKKARLPGSDS
jgi:transposase